MNRFVMVGGRVAAVLMVLVPAAVLAQAAGDTSPISTAASAAEAQTTDPGPAPEPAATVDVAPALPPPIEFGEKAPEPASAEIRRKWGLGSSLGGGFSVLSAGGRDYLGPGIQFPTLEIQAFTRGGNSVGISVPLVSAVISGALSQAFTAGADVFYNFNFGSGTARFVVGPGVGFLVATSGSAVGGSLRGLATIGVEFLTAGRAFGFKVAAQPYVQYSFAAAGDVSVALVTGGALLTLGFNWYGTTSAP